LLKTSIQKLIHQIVKDRFNLTTFRKSKRSFDAFQPANRRSVGVDVVTEGIGNCQPFVPLIFRFVSLSAVSENSTNVSRYQPATKVAGARRRKDSGTQQGMQWAKVVFSVGFFWLHFHLQSIVSVRLWLRFAVSTDCPPYTLRFSPANLEKPYFE